MKSLRLTFLAAMFIMAPTPNQSNALQSSPAEIQVPSIPAGAPVPAETVAAITAALYPVDACGTNDSLCLHFAEDGDEPSRGGEHLVWHVGGAEVDMTRFQAWRQMRCLAYTAWAEARGEGAEGMLAVMQVIVNRAAADGHPDTPCLNVAKRGQFEVMSFKRAKPWLQAARDRNAMVPDIPETTGADKAAAKSARVLAWRLMTGQIETDIVEGATFYATRTLVESGKTPRWIREFHPVTEVGEHVFFTPHSPEIMG